MNLRSEMFSKPRVVYAMLSCATIDTSFGQARLQLQLKIMKQQTHTEYASSKHIQSQIFISPILVEMPLTICRGTNCSMEICVSKLRSRST